MNKTVVQAISIAAVPFVAFLVGLWAMNTITDHDPVEQKLKQEKLKPLGMRCSYNIQATKEYFNVLGNDLLPKEEHFLKLDLVFPFVYGGALLASLLVAWALLGRPFNRAWIISPILLMSLADWTENVILLRQIKLYQLGAGACLEGAWIRVASIATVVKLSVVLGTSLLLIGLVVLVIVRAFRSP